MNTPIEIETHTPRVGRKNRPAPVLDTTTSSHVPSSAAQAAPFATPLHEKTRRKLEAILKGGAGAEKTTVLVATLARDVLNEERPFQPFMDAVDMLSRFGGWEYGFFLYCVRRRAATLLQKLAPSSRTAEIKAAQAWAAELDSDGGGD